MKNLNIFKRSLTLAMILLMLLNSMVLADNVQNDVTAGGNVTIIVSGSTTVNYKITANSGDGETGCNATGASPAIVTINVPIGVTANPSSLSFSSCGSEKPVVFSSTTVGNYEITVSVSDSGPGTYNTTPAKFTLKVLSAPPPSDSTPPVITPSVVGTLGNNGWYVSDVIVSWTVEDDESDISLSTGCDPTTINTDTNSVTLTCSATSAGGTATESVTIERDATPPSISFELTPPQTGWYNVASGTPTVTYTCIDALSGVASCSSPQLFSEGANQSHTGTAVDNAGNIATTDIVDVDVDLTNPVVTADLVPDPASSGWFNSATGAPTVTFTCSDATSGIASCPGPYTFPDSPDQSHSGTAYDQAGNSANAGVEHVNVDLTAPEITWVGGIANGASFYFGSVPAAPTCETSDSLSGPDGCSVTGYSSAVGSQTLTATAFDIAGNKTEETRTYEVLAWNLFGFYKPVDMGNIWNTVKAGSTVPLKFEIFVENELMDVAVVKSFTVAQVQCDLSASEAQVEFTTTGGTSLRYDPVAGQFIQNWQTPKLAGKCVKVTMTSQDGSTLQAFFKLK